MELLVITLATVAGVAALLVWGVTGINRDLKAYWRDSDG